MGDNGFPERGKKYKGTIGADIHMGKQSVVAAVDSSPKGEHLTTRIKGGLQRLGRFLSNVLVPA
jgi:hypothetical protein